MTVEASIADGSKDDVKIIPAGCPHDCGGKCLLQVSVQDGKIVNSSDIKMMYVVGGNPLNQTENTNKSVKALKTGIFGCSRTIYDAYCKVCRHTVVRHNKF